MKKIMVTGTFDGLHEGHINYFSQAKEEGDYLAVVVARDVTAEKEKGRKPHFNENERLAAVRKLNIVDEAVLGDEEDKLKSVERLMPDVLLLGYDQRVDMERLKTDLKNRGLTLTIKRAKAFHPERYKSSLMRRS